MNREIAGFAAIAEPDETQRHIVEVLPRCAGIAADAQSLGRVDQPARFAQRLVRRARIGRSATEIEFVERDRADQHRKAETHPRCDDNGQGIAIGEFVIGHAVGQLGLARCSHSRNDGFREQPLELILAEPEFAAFERNGARFAMRDIGGQHLQVDAPLAGVGFVGIGRRSPQIGEHDRPVLRIDCARHATDGGVHPVGDAGLRAVVRDARAQPHEIQVQRLGKGQHRAACADDESQQYGGECCRQHAVRPARQKTDAEQRRERQHHRQPGELDQRGQDQAETGEQAGLMREADHQIEHRSSARRRLEQ